MCSGFIFLNEDMLAVLYSGLFQVISKLSSEQIARSFCLPMDLDPIHSSIYWPTSPRSSQPPFLRPQKWCNDPSLEIFVLEITWAAPDLELYRVFFAISKKKFIEAVERNAGPTWDVDWGEWGPDTSRCFPSSVVINEGYSSVSGSRFSCCAPIIPAYPSPPPLDAILLQRPKESHIQILDFNPRFMKTGETTRKTEKGTWFVVTNPWLLEDEFFTMPVETRLPFRAFVSDQNYTYEEVYMDGESIIGSEVNLYMIQ